MLATSRSFPAEPGLRPVVEIEEDVYKYEPANNGAGPMWCRGSTCLVRIGDQVFASGLDTLPDAKPLNNVRWLLFKREAQGWKRLHADPVGRTREPCPLVGFPDGRLFLSNNPTRGKGPEPGGGPARPEVIQFNAKEPARPFERLLPVWAGNPPFSEHTYRNLVVDTAKGEMILLNNIGYTHAEWAFCDGGGKWSAQGKLVWPWGADYQRPQPIRICYAPTVLKNRAVFFCGVSDIAEPNPAWRAYKKKLTGREWDYDFRRLFFTWTSDITTGKFHDWIEIASRDKTAGWITPGDMWVDSQDQVHLIWTERAIDERLQKEFFPLAKQSHELNYAVVKEGKVIGRKTLLQGGERGEIPTMARFQVTPDNRLFVFYYVHGTNAMGQGISENRLVEIGKNGSVSQHVRVPLQNPFPDFFTATIRAGSPPSRTLEVLGPRAGRPGAIGYAAIRLW